MLYSFLAAILSVFCVYGVYCTVRQLYLFANRKRFRECAMIPAQDSDNTEDLIRYALFKYPDMEILVVNPKEEEDGIVRKLTEDYQMVHVVREEKKEPEA